MGTLLVGSLPAEVRLAALFTDGAVLQRGQPIRLWGSADPGERVEVEFAGKAATATAGPDGRWLAALPALAASPEGRDLRVAGTNTITVRDVLIGDVWICSGQSNMEFAVKNAREGSAAVAAADEPRIRHIKIGRRLAEQPVEEFGATAWRRADPAHVGAFTAVGYFFAREMVRETGVPVGIINCTWSGTAVEPWMSAQALAERPEFAVVHDRWRADLAAYPERRKLYEGAVAQWEGAEKEANTRGEATHALFLQEHRRPRPPAGAPDHPYPGNPSQLYNGMVHPLRHAAIRGVLWYQGEANAVRAREYAALFEASIRGWRSAFGQPELPFFWVQIASFEVDTDWPRLREAQAHALKLSMTGMAVAIDIGDPQDIHPANKQEVGRRLSLIALARLEQRAVEYSGPVFAGADFGAGMARVRFTHADGLQSRGGPVTALELAGADRIFHPAEGVVAEGGLVVRSVAVPAPVAVRYAWSAAPQANLYNLAGLPSAPFRSDDW